MHSAPAPLALNPYAAPQSLLQAPVDAAYSDVETKELKTLHCDARTIRGLAAVLCLAGLASLCLLPAALIASHNPGLISSAPCWVLSAVLFMAGGVGLYRRDPWARYVGIVCGVLLLPAFPVGTLIGAFGVIALIRSRRLFGKESFVIARMNQELKQRRRHQKQKPSRLDA